MTDNIEARFLRDIADHQMTILRDDGVNRHIRFRKPGTVCYGFDLVTWPGALCYTGDMGTYVFQRLEDMFEFFRTDRRGGNCLTINPQYWSEKLIATNCHGRSAGGATEFDPGRFRQVINEYRVRWMREAKLKGCTKEERRDLWDAVDDEVLWVVDDGEHLAYNAAYDFTHRCRDLQFCFTDLFEHCFERYTVHFTWCCYALAWGIQQYDAAAAKVEACCV